MPTKELNDRLQRLHEELADINVGIETDEPIDEATIEAMKQLMSDVGEIFERVEQAKHNEGESNVEHHALRDELDRFETQHPRATQFITQLADLLAMMGI